MSDMLEQEIEAVKQDIRRLDDKVTDVEAEASASGGHVNDLLNWVRRFRILDWISMGDGIDEQESADGLVTIESFYDNPPPFEVIHDYTYTPSSTEAKCALRGGLFDVVKSGEVPWLRYQSETETSATVVLETEHYQSTYTQQAKQFSQAKLGGHISLSENRQEQN